MKNTFEEYKKAILAAYKVSKTGKNSHYLLDPTPANLKKMASEISVSLSAKDEQAVDIFFNFKPDTNQKAKSILLSDTDKFRPLSKFLNSKTSLQDITAANILAVLVEFENRPFVKFRQNDSETIDGKSKSDEAVITEGLETEEEFVAKTKRPKIAIIAMLLLVVGISAFAITKSFEEKCMVWVEDHYEQISCEPDEKQGLFQDISLEPLNEEKLEYFKKIEINDSTIFFKNEKPIVWYIKRNKKCEFFSAPGVHPISKKSLREVTPYIIGKYCLKK